MASRPFLLLFLFCQFDLSMNDLLIDHSNRGFALLSFTVGHRVTFMNEGYRAIKDFTDRQWLWTIVPGQSPLSLLRPYQH